MILYQLWSLLLAKETKKKSIKMLENAFKLLK